MLQLNRFYLKNYHLWRSVNFEFEPGVTLVRGRNRSGKTLLFRAIKQALRAQVERRGSSLSRIPNKATIGLDFSVNRDMWSLKMTQSLLSLVKESEDQGSTGKRAARDLLNRTITISPDLFDSTIHVSGSSSHPLIDSPPPIRLAWISSVLNLTDIYDRVSDRISDDLKEAVNASTKLYVLKDELNTIEVPPDPPDINQLRDKLSSLRKKQERYGRAVSILDTMDHVRVKSSTDTYASRIEKTQSIIKRLKRDVHIAQRWEDEYKRVDLINSIKDKLAKLGKTKYSLSSLNLFCRALDDLNSFIIRLNKDWESSREDRKDLRELRLLMESAPNNLNDLIDEYKAIDINARRQFDQLEHVKGSTCPLCNASLDNTRRKMLMDKATKAWRQAQEKLRKLNAFQDGKNKMNELERDIGDIRKPPIVSSLTPILDRLEGERERTEQAKRLNTRLKDLEQSTSGEKLEKPEFSVSELTDKLQDQEDKLVQLKADHGNYIKFKELEGKLTSLFGGKWDAEQIREEEEIISSRIEKLVIKVANVESTLREIEKANASRTRLKEEIKQLKRETSRIDELGELKEAMGKRGLRLLKVKELVEAFQSEFNSLVSLIWDEKFELDMSVKETGINIMAIRHNAREDLLSLCGSETKVFRLITALALIRILPDRYRCDSILLDELEANLDMDTRTRFVTDYLEKLRESVNKVILISPLDYKDLPIALDREYLVNRKDGISTLERAA